MSSSLTVPLVQGFTVLPLPLAQLSLAAVLACGQSFRWFTYPLAPTDTAQPAHEYRFCLRDRVICLRQSPTALLYRAVYPDTHLSSAQLQQREAETLVWLKDYFQLDVDLLKLYAEWGARDEVFARLKDRFSGIRMLRQDPWENLISFICSSNNNISRISKMVHNLCKEFSPPLLSLPVPHQQSAIEELYHPFPPPSVLAKPEVSAKLRSLGFGYRAEFIQRTAQMLVETHGTVLHPQDAIEMSEKWLFTLRQQTTEIARTELLKFVGVGRKVADCVLLMSLDKTEVVPVDTHVHQIAVKHYGLKGSGGKTNMTPKLYEEVNAKLERVWGSYAGWAHSVLFTSDLKSFSLHGLPTQFPASSSPRKRGRSQASAQNMLPTPPPTPALKDSASKKSAELPVLDETEASTSVAERVKKRQRVLGKGLPP